MIDNIHISTVNINRFARVSSIASNAIIILIVGLSFDSDALGNFYLIYNLLFLQFLFEMGISKVSAQIIANKLTLGQSDLAERYSEYFRALYFKIAIVAAISVFLIGMVIMPRQISLEEGLIYPWLIASVGLGLSVYLLGQLAQLEGRGKMRVVAKSRLLQTAAHSLLAISFLLGGMHLYAVPLSIMMSTLLVNFCVKKLQPASKEEIEIEPVKFSVEVWPFLKQTSFTWIGGFFSYYCYVPFLANLASTDDAGRFGLTFQIIFSISSFSLVTLQTGTFRYANIRNTEGKDAFVKVFAKDLIKTLLLFLVMSQIVLLMLYPKAIDVFGGNVTIGGWYLQLLIFGCCFQTLYIGLGYFTRAQNNEKFYWVNLINAAITIVSLVVFAKYGAEAVTLVYFLTSLFCYGILTSIAFCRELE